MSNRAQRRAAAKKRPGENFADVLAKQRMVKAAVDKSVCGIFTATGGVKKCEYHKVEDSSSAQGGD